MSYITGYLILATGYLLIATHQRFLVCGHAAGEIDGVGESNPALRLFARCGDHDQPAPQVIAEPDGIFARREEHRREAEFGGVAAGVEKVSRFLRRGHRQPSEHTKKK